MAVASSLDWSIAAGISRNNRKSLQYPHHSHYTSKTKTPFPFFNSNSRAVTPVLEDDAPAGDPPVIELALKLQDFQPNGELDALICSLLKDPQTEHLAYDYYQKAKEKPAFKLERYSMKLLIRYLTRSKNWTLLSHLSEDLEKSQVLPDKSTCCRLIATCIKARKLKIVSDLLRVFVDIDVGTAVVAFDCAMKGYNQLHMYSTSVSLFQRMRSEGLNLDNACYSRIMEAYLKLGHYEKAVAVFHDFESKKMIEAGNSDSHSPRIYWILCESLGKLGRVFEALEYLREMQKREIKEDHSHYSSLIASLASKGEVKMAEELMQEAENKKMLRDPALFLKLVLRYIEEGTMEKTLDVVQTMKRVNIRVSDCIFCAIINGYAKKRGVKIATQVYEDLIMEGCEAGQVTYASVINMYTRLGVYFKAETAFGEMEKKGFHKCVVAYSSIIVAYGKMGRTKDAMKLVGKMKERGCEPNLWTYNSLLDMNGKLSNLRQVEKTWKEMKRRKIEADRVSYTTVISAYHRARELEMCIKYYEEFKLTGGSIDKAMAGIMVSVLSKMNRVDELVELLQDMSRQGTKLDARFYRSAMNALTDAGLQLQATWLQQKFKYS
ncbi:hypothetical protein ACS0TY_026940 [Phlomoides rotata]